MADKVSTAVTLTASTGTVVLGLTQDQWSVIAIIVGIGVTVATFVLNAWFKAQHLKLARVKAGVDEDEA